MWKELTLRKRLFWPLGAMFVTALVLGAVLLRIFASAQLADEHEPAGRVVQQLAEALNATLRNSPNPQQTLDAFAQSLGAAGPILFRRAGAAPPVASPPSFGRVPGWFVDLLVMPEIGAAAPLQIDGSHVGDVIFAPDLSADVYEKWIAFLAIAYSSVGLALLTGIIAYFIAGAALGPLGDLERGLTRMRKGDYDHLIAPAGPPEIRQSAQEANELARTLKQLSHDNRTLLRRMVSLQDDERRDLARELHDELGPLLFGIRANAVALADDLPEGQQQLDAGTAAVIRSVEALQQANRRILDRLRPLYIHELGLENSIQTLLRNAQSQAPQLKLTAEIDARLAGVDGILSQTIYRVIQEGVTNVLRHAKASSMHVRAEMAPDQVVVEVSDDGVGPQANIFGRGLTGMQERARALGGTLQLLRANARTTIQCRLPTGQTESKI